MLGKEEPLVWLGGRLKAIRERVLNASTDDSPIVSDLLDTLEHSHRLIQRVRAGLSDEDVIAFTDTRLTELREELGTASATGQLIDQILTEEWNNKQPAAFRQNVA